MNTHDIKKIIGHINCTLHLLFWNIRDRLCRPTETALLVATHPDDETLFFYQFIQEYKPYVLVLTGCSSVHRLSSLSKAMKRFGVKFRAYNLDTSNATEESLRKRINKVYNLGDFSICATHNFEGEYGHAIHKKVHKCVIDSVSCPIVVPVSKPELLSHPLDEHIATDKLEIFNSIYASEDFVPNLYGDWIRCEKLVAFTPK